MVTYNEQLNSDVSCLGHFLLAALKMGAAFLLPVAIAAGTIFAVQEYPGFAFYIASAMYGIAGIKFLLDSWMLYSIRLYRGEHSVNRELNLNSVKSWFKWTAWSSAVAIAIVIALAHEVTFTHMVNCIL